MNVRGVAYRADGNYDVSTPAKRAAACEQCLRHILVVQHVHGSRGDAVVLAEILRMVDNVISLIDEPVHEDTHMNDDEKRSYTVQVYRDEQDPENEGWAYRCDHGPTGAASGGLDGYEGEQTLSLSEATELATEAMGLTGCNVALVYWHGEQDPLRIESPWRPVRFGFDGSPAWDGYTDGTRWNGFLNVEVSPVVHDKVVVWFREDAARRFPGEPETIAEVVGDLLAIRPNKRGRYSYACGFATTECTEETP